MTNIDDEELIPTRRTLLGRLKRVEDHASWSEFFEKYWRLVYCVCQRCGLNEQDAQEVVQDTFIALSKSLPKFVYSPDKCAFKTWLFKVTQNRVRSFLRKEKKWHERQRSAASEVTELENGDQAPDEGELVIEKVWEEEWQKNLLNQAMHRTKQKVSPLQFQIFDLYVIKELPVSDVMRMLKVNRPRVYLAKHRIGRLIQKELQVLEDGSSCK